MNCVDGTIIDAIDELTRVPKTKNIGELLNLRDSLQTQLGSKVIQFNPKDFKYTNTLNSVSDTMSLLDTLASKSDDKVHSKHLKDLLGNVFTKNKEALKKTYVYMAKKAEDNFGVFDRGVNKIYLSLLSTSRGMAPDTVYAHEIMHAVTDAAYSSNNPKVVRQLEGIRKLWYEVAKQTTYKDFVSDDITIPIRERILEAKDTYNYIFNNKDGIKEFIAYGTTDPKFMEILKDKDRKVGKTEFTSWYEELIYKIAKFITDMFENFKGNRNSQQYLQDLVLDVAAINNKTIARNSSKIGYGLKLTNDQAVKYITKPIAKRLASLDIPTDMHPLKKLAIASVKITDNSFRRDIGRSLSRMGLSPTGTLRWFINSISDKTEAFKVYESLRLLAGQVDKEKMSKSLAVENTILEGMNTNLSEQDKHILGSFMNTTDIQALGMTSKELVKLLASDTKITSEIDKLEGMLPKSSLKAVQTQTKGLAEYMTTGMTTVDNQYLSAEAIGKKLGASKHIATIDKITSLKAIQASDSDFKVEVSKLLEAENKASVGQDTNGIDVVLMLQKTLVEEVKDKLYKDNIYRYIKGSVEEVDKDNVDIIHAKLSSEADMVKKGYKLHSKFDDEVGIYVTDTNHLTRWNRGAIRTINKDSFGHKKYSTFTMLTNSGVKAKDASFVAYKEKLKGSKSTGKYKKIPVLGQDGKVQEYRYTIPKVVEKALYKSVAPIDRTLGKGYADLLDKVESYELNKKVLDTILTDGLDKVGNPEYTWIGEDAKGEDNDVWAMMPPDLKDMVTEKSPYKNKKGFYVRSELKYLILGYREVSLSNYTKSRQGKIVIRLVERILQDLTSILKVDIVIKTPSVIIGNIVSNTVLPILKGENPIENLRRTSAAVVMLTNYQRTEAEYNKLETRINAGLSRDKEKLARLKKLMDDSPLKPLLDTGMFATINEDIALNNLERASEMPVSNLLDRGMNALPTPLRTVVDNVWVTKNSPYYKFMSKATQYSDFVSRYALYTQLIESGTSKDKALDEVLDSFINYDTPDSKIVDYSNRMGLLMFTKYFVGIQRTIHKAIKDNPIYTLLLVATQTVAVDVADPTDDYFVTEPVEGIAGRTHLPGANPFELGIPILLR